MEPLATSLVQAVLDDVAMAAARAKSRMVDRPYFAGDGNLALATGRNLANQSLKLDALLCIDLLHR